MTRETAKVLTKLSKEDLGKVCAGYEVHYDVLCAFARGAKIEHNILKHYSWVEVENPSFYKDFEYRVKPNGSSKSHHPWKPKEGETYFFISVSGKIKYAEFCPADCVDPWHLDRLKFGNCFRSREEAEAALDRVISALKGETGSQNGNS